MFAKRTFELPNVDPAHSKIATTGYWSQHMVDLNVADVARLQRMMCNRGMKVIGDTSPALQRVCAVNRTAATPSMQFELDFKDTTKWKRRVELDAEDQAWERKFTVKSSALSIPKSGVDTGLKVGIDHAPPELSVFAEFPQYKAIKAAGRVAVRLDDAGIDNVPYLNQVEQWWGFPNKFISDRLNKVSYPISIPRLIAAGGKTTSPLYGLENFAGLVRFVQPSVTREHFERDNDESLGNVVCVDFAVYRAAAKFATISTIQVPGKGSKQMQKFKGVVGFNLHHSARIVVTPASRNFVIPQLDIKRTPMETQYVQETVKAIDIAQSGRLAVIAGVAVQNGEELISYETRQRMGGVNIKQAKRKDRIMATDVIENSSVHGQDFAASETGILEYCVNSLGASRDHLLNGLHSLGGLYQIVYESYSKDPKLKKNKLTQSLNHCKMLASLWAPDFTMNLQRVCRTNGQELSAYISVAPESYPYIARVSYMVLKSRMNTVLSKIRELNDVYIRNQTLAGRGLRSLTIRTTTDIIASWANFYASKSKNTDEPYIKVRAQILSAFYSHAEMEGTTIAFPDTREFMISVGEKYTRRRKLPQLRFDDCKDAGDVAALLDASTEPVVRFTAMLNAIVKSSALTLEDLQCQDFDALDIHMQQKEVTSNGKTATAEEIKLLEDAYADDDIFGDLKADASLLADNKRGPLLMRNKFYAICQTMGSESDFIKRMYRKDYLSFDSWYATEPGYFDESVAVKCEKYCNLLANEVVAEVDDEDVLNA